MPWSLRELRNLWLGPLRLRVCTFIETFFLEVRKGVEVWSGEMFRCSLVTYASAHGPNTDRSYCICRACSSGAASHVFNNAHRTTQRCTLNKPLTRSYVPWAIGPVKFASPMNVLISTLTPSLPNSSPLPAAYTFVFVCEYFKNCS